MRWHLQDWFLCCHVIQGKRYLLSARCRKIPTSCLLTRNLSDEVLMKPCKERCAMFLRRYSPCLQHGVRALCRPSFGHATGRRVASSDVLLLMVVVVKLLSELAP